jgi:hypothetical protein
MRISSVKQVELRGALVVGEINLLVTFHSLELAIQSQVVVKPPEPAIPIERWNTHLKIEN